MKKKNQNKNYSSRERSESRSLKDSSRLSSNNNSFNRIYNVVSKIPKGKVMTYGQVALLANVATPRVVGFALHVNKDPLNIPCHRVVFANGKLTPGYAFGGEDIQRNKLKEEGIGFNEKGEVILKEFRV